MDNCMWFLTPTGRTQQCSPAGSWHMWINSACIQWFFFSLQRPLWDARPASLLHCHALPLDLPYMPQDCICHGLCPLISVSLLGCLQFMDSYSNMPCSSAQQFIWTCLVSWNMDLIVGHASIALGLLWLGLDNALLMDCGCLPWTACPYICLPM